MPLERWSDRVLLVRLADDPQFTEDLAAFDASIGADVVLDFAAVRTISSTNLGRLLRLRKLAQDERSRLVLCGVSDQVWGTLLVTGLDCLFDFANDVATALAKLQIEHPSG